MGFFIFLLLAFALLILIISKNRSRKIKESSQHKITIQADFDNNIISKQPDTGDLLLKEDGALIINPKSTFPLTIYGGSKQKVIELKQLLEKAYTSSIYEITQKIAELIARSNLRCKEIDDYIKKYKPLYYKKLEQLKQESVEWGTLSDIDKDDLLVSFRQSAIDSLDVRPPCNLEYLFEYEPEDFTIDDLLIERYGFELIKFYLSHASNLDKVFTIPADHYRRKYFEQMVEKGLAIRGLDIPVNLIVNTLTIKEMNEIVADLQIKPFTRKNKGVEFLLGLPDIIERLRKKVAFRELFKLCALPTEFSKLNLEAISRSWNYINEVSMLLATTYINGGYAHRDFIEKKEYLDLVESWEILTVGDDACPYCKRLASKKYAKNDYPRVPLHIGCRCTVSWKSKGD
ncbi:MAG: hypothetical protein QHH43_07205 [Candidatus Saccharicenans sp.]|jgi:hypothetical protein|nr:hypothetical protein [Candidatus Saccharicenans sp.]MDH7575525.1 hypothetical protein [Candidatus Saccharicenans sp.]